MGWGGYKTVVLPSYHTTMIVPMDSCCCTHFDMQCRLGAYLACIDMDRIVSMVELNRVFVPAGSLFLVESSTAVVILISHYIILCSKPNTMPS